MLKASDQKPQSREVVQDAFLLKSTESGSEQSDPRNDYSLRRVAFQIRALAGDAAQGRCFHTSTRATEGSQWPRALRDCTPGLRTPAGSAIRSHEGNSVV